MFVGNFGSTVNAVGGQHDSDASSTIHSSGSFCYFNGRNCVIYSRFLCIDNSNNINNDTTTINYYYYYYCTYIIGRRRK